MFEGRKPNSRSPTKSPQMNLTTNQEHDIIEVTKGVKEAPTAKERIQRMATPKVSRKSIMTAVRNSEVKALILAILNEDNEDITEDILDEALTKWDVALNKGRKSTAGSNDAFIESEVVPFVLSAGEPVTAKQVNDAVVHAEKTNKASAMLRRAATLGMLSRDKVRKNASFLYAEPNYDWETYISEYDAAMAERAAARIAKARNNRKTSQDAEVETDED